ncbi:MAG: hypothetical protein JSV88_02765 [Candidatus Aminicenantes bacterium]|nr:MAG: hypothetical protein JSV88_02765 [Candidatus Aminicenantes bacterium]
MDEAKFRETEAKYKKLKEKHARGEISTDRVKAELKQLMVQDESGAYWMLGGKSGKWYKHDGTQWQEADPYEGYEEGAEDEEVPLELGASEKVSQEEYSPMSPSSSESPAGADASAVDAEKDQREFIPIEKEEETADVADSAGAADVADDADISFGADEIGGVGAVDISDAADIFADSGDREAIDVTETYETADAGDTGDSTYGTHDAYDTYGTYEIDTTGTEAEAEAAEPGTGEMESKIDLGSEAAETADAADVADAAADAGVVDTQKFEEFTVKTEEEAVPMVTTETAETAEPEEPAVPPTPETAEAPTAPAAPALDTQDYTICGICKSRIPPYAVYCTFCGAHQKTLKQRTTPTSVKEESELLIKSMQITSFLFFLGGVGIILGVILGASFGVFKDFLAGLSSQLPMMLSETRGGLAGGLIFACIGGIGGFVFAAILSLILSGGYNLIAHIFGGIRFKVKR